HDRRARIARRARALSVPPAWGTTPILVGDHIETSGNADCLRAAAAMFDWSCGFIDDVAGDVDLRSDGAWRLSRDALVGSDMPIIAVENTRGAEDLFEIAPPDGRFAVVVGNERSGISRALLQRADRVVQIPNASRHLNCLNVAAAAAVALYQ